MIIYYCLLACIGIFSLCTINIKKDEYRNKIVIISSCFLMFLVQALRHNIVGTDLISYLPSYSVVRDYNLLAGEKLLNYEIGYSLFSKFFSILNFSEQQYLSIVALTIIIPIAYTWYKNSKMPGLSVVLYITLGFFTFTFSGLRQSIAMAIAFYSFRYIKERKLFKFLIIIFLATMFHSSSIIFILAYFLYSIKIKNKYLIFIIPLFLIVFLLRVKIFSIIYLLWINQQVVTNDTGAYTMLFVMFFVYIVSMIFTNKKNEKNESNAYRNYMLVAMFIQIFASQSDIAMRAGYYFYIFITLLIPDVISRQKDRKVRLIGTLILIIMLLFFYHKTTSNGYLNVVPYKFFWN